jgi:hypothetical protein
MNWGTMKKHYVPVLKQEEFSTFILRCVESALAGENHPVYPPEILDLYALYLRVRTEKSVAILEIGSGWSTLVLAKALEENRISHGDWVSENIRHPNPYSLMTVDCSEFFQNIAYERLIPHHGETKVIPVISKVQMTTIQGQACHLFTEIPPFTADFVYLDGPDCDQVSGTANGMTVNFGSNDYKYGLPMAADPYLLEHFFWPGTCLVTDGRGANARFLRHIFKRNWEYKYDTECDQHVFHLNEPSWGMYSSRLLELKKTSV